RASEDGDFDLEARTLLVDVLNNTVEGGKGTVGNANLLADLEGHRGLRTLDTLLDLAKDALGLMIGNRNLLVVGTEKARDLRRVLDQVIGLVRQVRPHQHVAGEELALRIDLAAAADLNHLL